MGKKFFQLVSISILSTITIAGCSNQNNNVNESNKYKDFKVGIVTSKTGINDQSLNQTVWEAIEKTGKKHGWNENKNYKYINSKSEKDNQKQLKKFAKEDYDLIFAVGYPFEDAIKQVVKKDKKTNFALIDGIVEKPNVISITFHEEQSSFLAGIVAAMSTKSMKIGFIGGTKNDLIEKFDYGFQAGVKSIDPKIKVISKYANAFDQPEQGSKLASSMYKTGIDVIFQAAGKTGLGVFSEAKKLKKEGKKVWVIGVDRDQFKEGMPENVTLTSAVKDVDKAVDEVITKTVKGNFQGGRILRFSIKDKSVRLSKEQKNLNKDIIEQIKLYEENIKSGKIVVPTNKEEFDKFSPVKPKKEASKKKIKVVK